MDKKCVRCQRDIPMESEYCQYCGHNQTMPYHTRIENYLVWAILSTLLCCLPLGVVSIVYASKVDSKAAMGDIEGAKRDSENAKKWAIAAGIAGIVGVVIALIVNILGFMAILSTGGN